MDRNVDVRTPESIAFTYQLAGLGSRFLAVAIDVSVQVLTLLALTVGLGLLAERFPSLASARDNLGGAEKVAQAIAAALVIGVLFTLFFGYFILFEAFWQGQTPGKKLLGIRVVRDGGYPIDVGASLIRNLIRVGEQLIGFYLLAAASALLSPENKRLGDIAAGTIVVRDARLSVPDFSRQTPPVLAATRYLSGEERALVERFLGRRDELAADRRREIAAALASRVRERVPVELQRLDDEALLERL